jgi:4-amino-4-deoxy-L-arabinose transferase-like glycosyltransferase
MESIPKNQVTAGLLLLVMVFFFPGLGGYDLTAPDEPHFALVAQEMLTDNHWVLPHRNQTPYPDKPPFFFWTIALFSALAGGTVNAWTARLPSAISASLVLWMMWRWNRLREPDPREDTLRSILTVLILVSCFKFFFQARIAQIDMVLCLFTTAALTTGYDAITGKPYSPFSLGLFMGLGILTKGPVGLIIPAGSLAVFAIFSGRAAWKKYPVKALAWAMIPVLAWLALLVLDVAMNNHWDYLNNLLFKQTMVRFFNPWHHHQPVYYFFVSVLYDFLPWTPFFLLAIPWTRDARDSLDSGQKFSWAVIVFTLVFFTLSKGKRSIYILPVFPFASYVTAAKIQWLAGKARPARPELAAGLVSGFLMAILGLGCLLAVSGRVDIPLGWVEAPLPKAWITASGVLLIGVSIFVITSVLKNRVKSMVAGLVSAMLIVNLLFFWVVLPWLDPFRSSRGFAEKMNRIITRQTERTSVKPVVGMVDYRSAYRLYGLFPLVELANEFGFPNPGLPKIENFFASHPEGWLIVRQDDWDQFFKNHEFRAKIHLQQKIGSGDQFLLITKDK